VTTVEVPASTPASPPTTTERPVAVAAAASLPAPKPPAPKPVPKPAPVAPLEWRVQLGAFSKRTQAEAAWSDVQTKQKAIVAKSKPIYAGDGSVTKLQIGPFPTQAAARDTCAKIAFSGRACFVTQG
jgi:cell division septation protein DedD